MARRGGIRRRMQIEWYGDEFLEIVRQYGDEALFAAARIVLTEASRRAPRKTGKLASSGYISTPSRSTYQRRRYYRKEKRPPPGGATVGFTAPHSHLIESGRRRSGRFGPRGSIYRDGVLRRTGKKALKIGDRLVARSRYKRMSSRPFLGPALEATKETMPQELARVLRAKLEQFSPRGLR